MPKILSIDASTEACSVALLNEQERTKRYQFAPRKHAQLLLPMVEELLAESELNLNQLDAVACHVGPGAFTGIRIAVSVAQGIAYGADLATISLSSLANLACIGHSKTQQTDWLCAIDARMGEVYFAHYQINQQQVPVLVDEELVIAPDNIDFQLLNNQIDLDKTGLIGSGWAAYEDYFFNPEGVSDKVVRLNKQLLQANYYPDAFHSLSLAEYKWQQGEVSTAEALQPVYLRNNVAVKKMVNK